MIKEKYMHEWKYHNETHKLVQLICVNNYNFKFSMKREKELFHKEREIELSLLG